MSNNDAKTSRQQKCTICKHLGAETLSPHELERANLYSDSGGSVAVLLCRKHSVELFKLGQKKFLLAYYRILEDVVDSDEPKFLDILRSTVRNNADHIY